MTLDKNIIEQVAHLARIELDKYELERLSGQLEHIIGFIDKLKQVDVEGILPTSHAISMSNVVREDIVQASLPSEKALANTPAKKEKAFLVPKVIE